MSFKFFILLFLSCNFAFADKVIKKESCYEDIFCITREKLGKQTTFFIRNKQPAPITVTLSFKLVNMSTSIPTPATSFLRGHEKKKVLSIKPINPKRKYKYNYRRNFKFGDLNARHEKNLLYDLPWKKGKTFKVSQSYNGSFSHKDKNAVDFSMPEGTAIHAARAGEVVAVKEINRISKVDRRYYKFANYIFIQHSDKTLAKYSHVKYNGAVVRIGQKIEQGELIGYSGTTGYSSGPHLHFEVFRPIDGKNSKTFPVKFKSSNKGIVLPEKGMFLTK